MDLFLRLLSKRRRQEKGKESEAGSFLEPLAPASTKSLSMRYAPTHMVLWKWRVPHSKSGSFLPPHLLAKWTGLQYHLAFKSPIEIPLLLKAKR
jgi:hypothetical protein